MSMTDTITDAFDEACNPPLFKQPGHKLWRPVRDALMSVYDPEIETSIFELGLIYKVDFKPNGKLTDVAIDMTLTRMTCPAAQSLPAMTQSMVSAVEGVGKVTMQLVFTPTWGRDHMSDNAKVASGLMY